MILGLLAVTVASLHDQVKSDDQCRLLVVTLRHRRDQFPSSFTSFKAAVQKFEPLQYDLLRKGQGVLAVDRAIYGRIPEVIQARLLDFLVRRGFAPCLIRDLPEGAKEAVVDNLTSTFPNIDPASVPEREFWASPAVTFAITPPSGAGTKSYYKANIPIEDLPSARTSTNLSSYPAVESGANKAELRMFIPGRAQETSCLPLWDELRPLMREAEKKLAQDVSNQFNTIPNEARLWLETKLGAKQGDPTLVGSLAANAKTFLQQMGGVPDSVMDGGTLSLGRAEIYLSVALPPNGRLTTSLRGIGR